ncbi:hypothetical protein K503DRAFT_429912 [Rhizopogon vinicolor AM-OR11-026]|uniref:F-box domain-containing protein n=1 Tax=Rhizopogon vinicolor AM-OR11-026 TaxID=1314800 RepID=A0A1B7MPT5_9AGAM|nr:hypothetical protein K503DRAFT_429912 [Rhizopogon vinicolor AM-OR11-026]
MTSLTSAISTQVANNTTLTAGGQSVHACMLIQEILKQIFSDIYSSCKDKDKLKHDYWRSFRCGSSRPERKIARRSLAALSRVCRSFKDVALDVLWAELDNMEPLFTCLPRDLWHMSSRNGMLTMRRPVTMADWSIFDRYASRVRALGVLQVDSDIFGRIHEDFIHAIMCFSSKSLLVPKIQTIYSEGSCSDVHSCIRYILGPDLTCLHLAFTDVFWSNVMSSALSSLKIHSPRLKVLDLAHVPSQINELVLSELVHLQEVSLTLVNSKAFHFHTSTLDVLRIRCMSTLTFIAESVGYWVVPCLCLYLITKCCSTAPNIELALYKMNNRVLCDGLEEFRYDVPDVVTDIASSFSIHTFTPLMRFSSLKVVDLASFCMSLLDDDALGSIVNSWPHLECLYLGTGGALKEPPKPKVTFQGLVTVLSSCLDLRELGLVFDATRVDPPTAEKPGAGVYNTNITTLHVGFSQIKQPLQSSPR